MRQRTVAFQCGSLALEGVCHLPPGRGAFPAVALCHPHPLYGGSMDNSVILAVSAALVDRSIAAFRFNFRGVGGSEGSFDGGVGEQADAAAAIAWLESLPEVDHGRLGLLGYSFGASVALAVACGDERVRSVALVSPPLEPSQAAGLKGCARPKLLISGAGDQFVPAGRLNLVYRELAEPKRLEIIPDADHFWQGYETALAEKAAAFFGDSLKQAVRE